MKTTRNPALRLLLDESGQDLVEYGLIVGLIGLGTVIAMSGLASNIGVFFSGLGSKLTSAT